MPKLILNLRSTKAISTFAVHYKKQINAKAQQETTETYKFRNIRYAQAPIGELRFAAPVAPETSSNRFENGSVTRICPQSPPAWNLISQQVQEAVIAGNVSDFNFTAAQEQLQEYLATAPPPTPDPTETEDCLFLDVYVPKAVLNNARNRHLKRQNWTDHHAGAPVLLW